MLILLTSHSYVPQISGVASVVEEIATRLARRGHEVHVATSLPTSSNAEEVIKGVCVHRFGVHGSALDMIRGDVDGYLRFVRTREWDVIMLHCAQSWTTDALLPFLEEMSGRKIFVGHGFSVFHSVEHRVYFDRLAEYLRVVDRIVALSGMLEESAFCKKYRLPDPVIIPNGVDLSIWASEPLSVREKWGIDKRPWIVSVSNHSPVKGHQAFFSVIKDVRLHVREGVGTIIGGHYPAAKLDLGRFGVKGGCWYICSLREMFAPGVMMRSNIPRLDVVSAVKEADVILLTSRREASSLVVLESMAAGTPWVSFDVGCVREHPGGVIVESAGEMVKAVLSLIGDQALRHRLGNEGRARASARHDWETIASKYEELFHSNLARS